MRLDTWLAFFVACWLISLSPGAGAIASMSSGLTFGFRRGFWNAIGLQIALIFQIAIVAAGVGAILATSELAFSMIKWFGVIYLLYLGWKQWFSLPYSLDSKKDDPQIGRRLTLVFRGFMVNASNPKAIVFILAVLPQFLDSSKPLMNQYLLMTVTMVSVDLIVMAAYTGLAAKALSLLREPRQQRLLNQVFGSLFGAAAVLLATVKQVAAH